MLAAALVVTLSGIVGTHAFGWRYAATRRRALEAVCTDHDDEPLSPARRVVAFVADVGQDKFEEVDIVQKGGRSGLMVGERVEEFAARARELVQTGRGRELMLMPGWWYAISAESFLDRLTETPDVLELAPGVKCPSLFVRGDKEPREGYPAEEFKARSGGPCTVEIISNCDHFYNGREEAVSALTVSWLRRILRLEHAKP